MPNAQNMFARVHSVALNGLQAFPVIVEVNASRSSKSPLYDATFYMVGLPDNSVKESRLRMKSALENSQIEVPRLNVTVNFAPADVRKEGPGFDLPLTIALLKCLGLVRCETEKYMFVGELGLDGSIRPVRGALSMAIEARKQGYDALFVPKDNEREAGVVNKLKVYGVSTLREVVDFLNGQTSLTPVEINVREQFYQEQTASDLDFADVRGQETARRAFEVAAAGGHNLLLIGSPGSGKSMMAKRLSSILPQLTLAEALETTQIYSIAGEMGGHTSLIAKRPFRSPHHTISDVALIGGGTNLKPGEISLAHNGVLFLDEFPEYSRKALETMRQPLEDRVISISRAKYSCTLPCSFMLIAAMNPCPCGYYNDPTHKCTCSPGQIQRYMGKISGPLLDRIDLHVEISPVPLSEISKSAPGESSAAIRERVVKARKIQEERFAGVKGIHCNAQMTEKMVREYVRLSPESLETVRLAMERLHLSARAYIAS